MLEYTVMISPQSTDTLTQRSLAAIGRWRGCVPPGEAVERASLSAQPPPDGEKQPKDKKDDGEVGGGTSGDVHDRCSTMDEDGPHRVEDTLSV